VKVAVVANASKTLGGGLLELRRELERAGIGDPLWYEVPKSKKARAAVKQALADGAELVFAWGGDGLVQRCIDVLAGSEVPLAVFPAGTSNLLATNLKLPVEIREAVAVGLGGDRRRIDVGRFNGERFAVMAGSGIDAAMIRDADGSLKDRLGRVAYVWAGLKHLRSKPFGVEVEVDGVSWFKGDVTSVLVGNLGRLFGAIEVFGDARPDDGKLEVGVITADGFTQWARTAARTMVAPADTSPFVQATKATSVKVRLTRKVLYELDGGDRTKTKSFKVKVEPAAVTLCVPPASAAIEPPDPSGPLFS
jgi:diacylglycerol kinase (ATP)